MLLMRVLKAFETCPGRVVLTQALDDGEGAVHIAIASRGLDERHVVPKTSELETLKTLELRGA